MDAGLRDAGARPMESFEDAGPTDAGDRCAEVDLERTSDLGCTFWSARAPNVLHPAFEAESAGGPRPPDVTSDERWDHAGSFGVFVLPERRSVMVSIFSLRAGWSAPRRIWHGPVDARTGRAIFLPIGATRDLERSGLLIRSDAPVAVWQFNPMVPLLPMVPLVACVPGRPSPCPAGAVCRAFEGVDRCVLPAASMDASQLMPARLFGTRHFAATPEGIVRWAAETTPAFGSQLTLIASEPDTEVSLTPRAPLGPFAQATIFGGADAGGALTWSLQRFEVLNLSSLPSPTPPFFDCTTSFEGTSQFCRNGTDLTGTLITSSKPVAVFSGSPCTVLPHFQGYCDFVEEQLPSTALWDRVHVLVPGPNHPDAGAAQPTHRYKVIADCASCFGGTRVTVSDPSLVKPVARAQCSSNDLLQGTCDLEAGEFFEFDLLGPIELTATSPVQVLHLVGGAQQAQTSTGDPAMSLVLPARHWPRTPLRVPAPPVAEHLALHLVWESALVSAQVDGVQVRAQLAFDRYQYATVVVDGGIHEITTEPPGAPVSVELYGAGPWGAFLTTGRRRFVELDGGP